MIENFYFDNKKKKIKIKIIFSKEIDGPSIIENGIIDTKINKYLFVKLSLNIIGNFNYDYFFNFQENFLIVLIDLDVSTFLKLLPLFV